MNSKFVWLGILIAAALIAALVYTSFGNRQFRCEVCMTYQGATACRRASGASREIALRAAIDNACAQIASGVTATMACTTSSPDSLKWLK